MKTILVVVGTVGLFTAPAVAGKPKKKPVAAPEVKSEKAKREMPALNLGDSYDLMPRRSVQPREEADQIKPKGLTDAQVSTVVGKRSSDIQHCWNKLPQNQRVAACTAMLRLSISDTGAVTAIEIGGDVPAGAHKCITSAVARWSFPAAEIPTEVETGISLRSL